MRSPLDLGFATVDVIEFSGTDLLAVRELVARGEIVVMRDEVPPPEPGSKLHRWPRELAESIGECALVPLACLTGAAFQRYPIVVGQREPIRFLCSYADELPPSPFPYQCQPVVTDYREFRHLWVVDGDSPANIFMAQVGMRMAELHSRNVLHGDAHLGNWGAIDDQVVVADPAPVFLYCRPSPEQCATDIRPLLPDLEPDDWLSFRLGYRASWPDEGRVIDLIQLGDLTGWAAPFRARDHALAAELLGRQLSGDCLPIVRVMLLANRALSLSRTGRHRDAWKDCLEAAKLAREHSPHAAKGLAFVQAMTLIGEGKRADAINLLRMLTDQPEQMLARFEPPEAQLPIMNM